MSHIADSGFCFCDMPKRWLEGVMDRATLKVLTDSDVPSHDQGFSEETKTYFAASAEEAERLTSSEDEKGRGRSRRRLPATPAPVTMTRLDRGHRCRA